MSGMPLNGELLALGGRQLRTARTLPRYRLWALPGGPPALPGLTRIDGDAAGAAIEVEVWALPEAGFARLVAAIPSPLGIGTVRLEDGTAPKGFLAEAAGTTGAAGVSAFGGWRRYCAVR